MKVLFLNTHVNMGGITRYLMILAKGLIEKGHEVHIASSGGEMVPALERLGAKHVAVNIRTKSELSPKLYAALRPLAEYIRDHGIDVIHAQTRVTQVMGHLLSRFTKVPYVSTCHGYFKVRLSRRVFPCWGDVIAISEAVRDHLVDDFHVPEKHVHLITHGLDLEEYPELSVEQRKENRRQFKLGDELVLGMIARLSDIKGQDILIRAMPQVVKKCPATKLLLFGEGRMKEKLMSLVDQLKLNERVVFYPIVNQASRALSVMNVFVVPSRQEGLGLSVMEAQACGVPVVASRVGGIPSLIEDGKTGILVPPHEPDALAEALIGLLDDAPRRNSMGLAARQHALNNYSSRSMVERTENVYTQVAAQSE